MAEQAAGITFDQVEKVASQMITQGVKPSVRGVIAVTGGKTENISKFLRDFFEKRQSEVNKMSDELGSSAIANLLAGEIQVVVDRKTAALQEIITAQKAELDELVELLHEKEKECVYRVEMTEAKADKAVREAEVEIEKANERAENAETLCSDAEAKVQLAEAEAKDTVVAIEQKTDILIETARSEADSLVRAADKRADKAEQEAVSLREQVKGLSIDQAKREIEQVQYETAQKELVALRQTLSDAKTQVVQLQTQKENQDKETGRLTADLIEIKQDAKALGKTQGQLVEAQTQLSQLKNELALSERERESLALALRGQRTE